MTDTTPRSRRAALIADATKPAGFDETGAPLDEEYRPAVTPRVRDAVYWTTLATAAASALASGIAGIWLPDIAPQVLATGGVVTTVMGIVGGGVGVVYRPGAAH
ncbi:hypothetical protein [uncultured Microbacterium sp.]|uniref:hypothetical protein n=1 Tax=uncultured Microbacterium sp. TaxID=191216 RepID=UPI0028E55EFE|nr:hypothetical protein [uncultured Microbacterium sp.]